MLLGSLETERVTVAQLEVDRVTEDMAVADFDAIGDALLVAAQVPATDNPVVGHADMPQQGIGAPDPRGQYEPIGHMFCVAIVEPEGHQ